MKKYHCFGDEITSIDIKRKSEILEFVGAWAIMILVSSFILMGLNILIGLTMMN